MKYADRQVTLSVVTKGMCRTIMS